MKDFFTGLALLICILALIGAALYAYKAGYDNGQLEMLLRVIGGKGKEA